MAHELIKDVNLVFILVFNHKKNNFLSFTHNNFNLLEDNIKGNYNNLANFKLDLDYIIAKALFEFLKEKVLNKMVDINIVNFEDFMLIIFA